MDDDRFVFRSQRKGECSMIKEPQVTFVVPMYNMEKYIDKCIQSILMQSLGCMEILVVDDGSTDQGIKIIKQYEEQYDFIRIIQKDNGGISSARNRGIAEAKGKYICFIDSDDFYHKDFAGEFYELCEKWDLDIIRGWYDIYDEQTEQYLTHPFPNIDFDGKCLTGYKFLEKTIDYKANEVVPWLGFFRRQYIIQNNIKFPEGISYEEDHLFFLEVLLCSDECKAMLCNNSFYSYRKRAGSATKTPTFKQAQDIFFVVQKELELIEKYQVRGKMQGSVKRYICSSYYQLTSIFGRVGEMEQRQIIRFPMKRIQWSCLRNPYDSHQFLKILLFTINPFFVKLIYKFKKI